MHTYIRDLKTIGHVQTLYILNNCSTIGDVYFLSWSWMRDMIGELWLPTCIAVLFNKPYVHAYMHEHIRLYYRTHSLCGLELQERSNWRAAGPQTHISRSLIQTSVRILQARMYIAVWCATTRDNRNSRSLSQHITHQMTASLPIMYCFIRTKLARYTTRCSVFQLIVNTNITMVYTALRVSCQAARKKKHN